MSGYQGQQRPYAECIQSLKYPAWQQEARLYLRTHYLKEGTPPKLTDIEKDMIHNNWLTFIQGDDTQAGLSLFMQMFEMYPHTKELFDFARGTAAAQMQNSSRVIFHVTRVIKYISLAVANLDHLEEVVPILRLVGGRHGVSGYGVPPDYLPHFCEALIGSMNTAILDGMTKRGERAWQELLEWIMVQMVAGMEHA